MAKSEVKAPAKAAKGADNGTTKAASAAKSTPAPKAVPAATKAEITIAEKLVESLHLMLDRARISASKQQVYLATIVPPELPGSSIYPERGYTVIITFFCCFAIWSAVSLIISGVKDQRI